MQLINNCQGTQIFKTERFLKSFSLLIFQNFQETLDFSTSSPLEPSLFCKKLKNHFAFYNFETQPRNIMVAFHSHVFQIIGNKNNLRHLSFIGRIWTFFAQNNANIACPECI